jgi:acyl-CoA thioester hydrolase
VKKTLINELELNVRFSELDPLGVVWHGNYFKFFEDGRDALGHEHGLDYLDMYNRGIVVPIVTCNAEFKSSIYYNNKIKVITHFVNSPAAKIIHRYEVVNISTGKVAATGETVQVFLDKDGVLQLNVPEYFLNWKKANGLG